MSGNSSHNSLWRNHKTATGPAIMESVDSLTTLNRDGQPSLPDPSTLQDVSLYGYSMDQNSKSFTAQSDHGSFLLIDGKEFLKVSSPDEFIKKLNCPSKTTKIKVVSIFGNTGDGKSHTMNHAIFEGRPVFKTSSSQNSCTLGVWIAFDPHLNIVCLDTEGLLGFTENEKKRTRLLLKVLAVSDVVIYRTRSERLHKDMFAFLGDASRAYIKHFHKALQAIEQKEGIHNTVTSLGPSIIIFQETANTKPLTTTNEGKSPEEVIRDRFNQADLSAEAFSSIKYVGVRTVSQTDFQPLREAIKQEINNTSVRSARSPDIVYNLLKNLNDKFSQEIQLNSYIFSDQYFTCTVKCLSCDSRCQNSMGHTADNIPHACETKCRFQHQFQNQVHICKKCYNNGIYNEVIKRDIGENTNGLMNMVKIAWHGYIYECKTCGDIYHSRGNWLSNSKPEEVATRTEVVHVWDYSNTLSGTENTAQWVIDNVSQLSEAVTSVAHQPTKAVTSWVADRVNPSYWQPNSEITECQKCHKPLTLTDQKHHCRQCGLGFCDDCCSKEKEVQGWGSCARVCDVCYEQEDSTDSAVQLTTPEDTTIRRISESVVSSISVFGSVFNYSKTLIKDHSRPSYWVPDSEITNCCVCNVKFIYPTVPLHHCRACGRGVCHNCSLQRKPVPRRNWPDPVRVCDACVRSD